MDWGAKVIKGEYLNQIKRNVYIDVSLTLYVYAKPGIIFFEIQGMCWEWEQPNLQHLSYATC